MGTNFDVRYNICEECGRYDDLHLGKSSIGWEFCFQGYEYHDFRQLRIRSIKDWKDFIDKNNGKIFDEYNRECTWDEIMTWTEGKKEGKKHESMQYTEYYRDSEGYSFTDNDFS